MNPRDTISRGAVTAMSSIQKKSGYLKRAVYLAALFATVTIYFAAFTDGKAEKPADIRFIENESYISEYSLATNGFFQPEVWSVLNADCRAFILESTTNNESNRYGISPRFCVFPENLGFSFDAEADESYLLKCDRTAFGWMPDDLYPCILIDSDLLEHLDAQDALFVCYKAFYYAYARYLVSLLDENRLPEQYEECIEQIRQYRDDLVTFDTNGSYVYTMLEDDAIGFGIDYSNYYYSYIFPDDLTVLSDRYLRIYWRECLNGVFKRELLQQLADELSVAYHTGTSYQIVSTDAQALEAEQRGDCACIMIDEELLENGDATKCIAPIVEALYPQAAAYVQSSFNTEMSIERWSSDATEDAWLCLKHILIWK